MFALSDAAVISSAHIFGPLIRRGETMALHCTRGFRTFLSCAVGSAFILAAVPAAAQVDIAGEWAARAQEDQPHRGPGAELGDYSGLPINAAARQKASHWDASILSLPEAMAKP